MKIRKMLEKIIAPVVLSICVSCYGESQLPKTATIPADSTYFKSHYKGRMLEPPRSAYLDTLDNYQIYLIPDYSLKVERNKIYPDLNGLEIENTNTETSDGIPIYDITGLNFNK